jgi:hypothetical protein
MIYFIMKGSSWFIGICRDEPPVLAAVQFAWQIVPPASSATAGVTITASPTEPSSFVMRLREI